MTSPLNGQRTLDLCNKNLLLFLKYIFLYLKIKFLQQNSADFFSYFYKLCLNCEHFHSIDLNASHTVLFLQICFHWQITRISIDQMSSPENKKCSP